MVLPPNCENAILPLFLAKRFCLYYLQMFSSKQAFEKFSLSGYPKDHNHVLHCHLKDHTFSECYKNKFIFYTCGHILKEKYSKNKIKS